MHRSCLFLSLALCLVCGCGRSKPAHDPRQVVEDAKPEDVKPEEKPIPVLPVQPVIDDHTTVAKLLSTVNQPGDRDRFDTALLEALGFLADKKYSQALVALETARSIRDTEALRQRSQLVKALMDQQAAAERSVQDIQVVLNEGKAEDAARLSGAALRQFGGGNVAEALAQLKMEADAVAVPPGDDKEARRVRLLREAKAAVADGNLRVAVIAYDQALQIADDADTRKTCDDIRASLARYDEQRTRAAQLRRDPGMLEDAIAALQDAQKAWDTPQVRLDLDEYTFALQKRRDRLSVADFEVRGDVGVPSAGRLVADELLPAFKSRFDLVERDVLNQLVGDLKLDPNALGDHSEGRQDLGRLARVRYLVVGSITPLAGGVTASARLVDMATGLIAQTARLSAPTMDVLVKRLPLLAQMLLLSDEQRLAFEQALAEQELADVKPIDLGPLPPPPPAPTADVPAAPPVPILTSTVRPMPLGGLTIDMLAALPPVVLDAPPPTVEVVFARDDPRRQRLLRLALELGDNLFRRGRWREANRQYALALNFCDDQTDIEVRLDRCRPFLPPVPAIGPGSQPRMIVFNFLLNAPPGLVPTSLGDWVADQLAAQLRGSYQIVDRGEVSWYMARLGLTPRDVLTDPLARACLAQALDVRYLVFGAIVHTDKERPLLRITPDLPKKEPKQVAPAPRPASSFDVSTHLIDAQTGAHTGRGVINVQDHAELKLAVHELAAQMNSPTDHWKELKLAVQSWATIEAIRTAHNLQKAGKYDEAAETVRWALKTQPENTVLLTLMLECQAQANQALMARAQEEFARNLVKEMAGLQTKHEELVKETGAARVKAEGEAKARSDAVRKESEARKQRVAGLFQAEGRLHMQRGACAQAVEALRSAVALVPSDAGFRELAQAQAKHDEQQRKLVAAALRKKEAQARMAREAALARIELESKRLAAEEAVRRKAQDVRDRAEYARLVDQARSMLAKGDYDKAQSAVSAARLLRPGDEVETLLTRVRADRDLAEAKKKGEQARLALEKRLAEEKARKEKADLEAKKKSEDYGKAVKAAQAALAEKKYDDAVKLFQDAGKLFRTDAVLTGLKTAEDLRDRARALADAEQKAKADAEKRAAQVTKLLTDGAKALAANDHDIAVKAYTEAARLAPGNVDALAGKSKAEQARAEYQARNRDKIEQEQKQARVSQLVTSGKAALDGKRYDEAVAALTEASKINPKDAETAKLLKDAEGRRDAARAQTAERVRDLIGKAQASITAKKYADAELYLGAAKNLSPNDPGVTAALKDLDTARKPSAADLAKLKQRQADFKLAMDAGRDAVKKKDYVGAVKSFKEAERLMPGDKDALDLLRMAERQRDESAKKTSDQAQYTKLMSAGQAALAARKYTDAITAYSAALKLMPADAEAKKGLADATALSKPMPNPQAEYTRLMKLGQTLDQQKKYPDAIKAYSDALKAMPNDAKARTALKNASYNNAMAEGLKAAQGKKFPDAIKAYEEALKQKPNDPDASAALKRAKMNKP